MNEKENQKKEEVKDDIVKDYDTVVREGSVLSSVSGIIFGFLLNISINSPGGFTTEDSLILMISLYSITFAVSFFVMPVVYHHLQYPYKDIDKFKIRSHQFIKFGTIPGAITMYLGLVLGLKFGLHNGIGAGLRTFFIYPCNSSFCVGLYFLQKKKIN